MSRSALMVALLGAVVALAAVAPAAACIVGAGGCTACANGLCTACAADYKLEDGECEIHNADTLSKSVGARGVVCAGHGPACLPHRHVMCTVLYPSNTCRLPGLFTITAVLGIIVGSLFVVAGFACACAWHKGAICSSQKKEEDGVELA